MILKTYGRFPVKFVSGKGSVLTDEAGKEYLDFAAGVGVMSVGHAHPKWIDAVKSQVDQLVHVSNLYHTEPAELLAEKLVELSGMSGAGVFFGNSGAEANEGLIKVARKYSKDKYGAGRSTIVTLKQSFHGRTITTLSATGQDKLQQHFNPFTEGFVHVEANDISEFENLGDGICAVLLEPIQGEGGVLPLDKDYVQQVAELCKQNDWLLLFDEVQTGIGRMGRWFGYEHFGVIPDGISFAKGVGGGLPIGGFIVTGKCVDVLGPGDHGSTYGGNPVAARGALAVLEIVEELLPDIEKKGNMLMAGLEKIDGLSDVRGVGLMIGAKVADKPVKEVLDALLESGMLALSAGDNILRLLPPLTVSEKEIEAGLEIISQVMSEI